MFDRAGIQQKVRRHQAGLVLDTNVLLAHVALKVSWSFAHRFKRTDSMSDEYFAVVVEAAATAEESTRLITTPHILTETTDLVGEGKAEDNEHREFKELLRAFALAHRERNVPAKTVAADPVFIRLGLADGALIFIGGGRPPLVLTDDLKLVQHLEGRGRPVAKVEHYMFPTSAFE